MRYARLPMLLLVLTTVGPSLGALAAAPRQRIFMDFHWQWRRVGSIRLNDIHNITAWRWRPARLARVPSRLRRTLAKSRGWKAVTPGTDVFHGRIGFAWFQTNLPAFTKTNRILHFDSIDDNGSIYLNRKFLCNHHGYNRPVSVRLDSNWNTHGPNVLTVLVQNTAGVGGLEGSVYLGRKKARGLVLPQHGWKPVQLPNDYIVDGAFSPRARRGHGYLPVYPAWYRRSFHLPATDKGKMLWLYFEGVYRHARIYVNGHLVGGYRGGYTGFRFNIAPFIRWGGGNQLAVRVDPTRREGWWYEGGGIYRNVWIVVTHRLHIAPFGTYIVSHVRRPITHSASTGDHAPASLTIQTTVINSRTIPASFTIESTIFNPVGRSIGHRETRETLAAGAQATFDQRLNLSTAKLWSLHHTHLYRLQTVIQAHGKASDKKSTTFGIRTIRFDANRGFSLNGKHVELKGVCNHQDFPAVGIGVPNNLWWWRVMMLKKELHANACRTAHNPVAPAFYRACDHLGMLVMDENRHPGDTQGPKSRVGAPYKNLTALKFMIQRDRNHPSIIMWSMCNEEWNIQATPYGAKVFRHMMKTVHQYDRTRPITCAMNGGYPDGFTHVENLLGINYNPPAYAAMHQLLPHLPIIGSETGSTCSDRGILTDKPAAGLVTQYSMHPGWAELPWEAWKPIATQRFVAGGFNWTGFDYRGEPTPDAWPDINSHFGLLDVCGFPKPGAYYYRAWWGNKPLVYICPEWNLPAGLLGKSILIRCFSNCDRVELWLNKIRVAQAKMPRYGYVDWHVPYQPGVIQAKGFDHGSLMATWTQRTTGPAAGLQLTNEWPVIRANGEDIAPIAVAVVDKHGYVVSNAMNMVHFALKGPGKIVGCGNGDPACHEPNQATGHRAFYGYCMVLVQAGHKLGNIILTATARGLPAQTLVIPAK